MAKPGRIETVSMADWPLPVGYEPVVGLDRVRAALRHNPPRRRIHNVGRVTNEDTTTWCGLYMVPHYVVKHHFGILPGCEFPEIFVQAAVLAAMAEQGWAQLRTVRAIKQGYELADLPRGFKGIEAGKLVVVMIDHSEINDLSKPGSRAKEVILSASGRLIVEDILVANVVAKGSAFVRAD